MDRAHVLLPQMQNLKRAYYDQQPCVSNVDHTSHTSVGLVRVNAMMQEVWSAKVALEKHVDMVLVKVRDLTLDGFQEGPLGC